MRLKIAVLTSLLISFLTISYSEIDSNFYKSVNAKMYEADSIMLSYRKSNPDSALFYGRVVLYNAKLIGDTGSVDYAHMHLGSINRVKGNLDSAIWYYNLALESYKIRNFEEGIASVYNNLANIYKLQSRYDLAIKNYHEALTVFKGTTNFKARANLYSSFAGLYFKLENYEKAEELWTVAKDEYARANDWAEISYVYKGFAKISLKKGELNEAENFVLDALELDQKNGITIFLLEDYLLLMEIYLAQKNFSEFMKYENLFSNTEITTDLQVEQSRYNELMGNYYLAKKENENAEKSYHKALDYLHEVEFDEETLRILKKLLSVQINLNKKVELTKTISRIEKLEFIVSKNKKERLVQEFSATYELADKEERINLLTEKNAAIEELAKTEQEIKERRGRQLVISFFVILFVLALLIYIAIILRKQIRIQKQLKVALAENEVLYKELNHRVKNNLHIVSGFLGIEMHGRSDEVVSILKTCERRIQSLGYMHELLYQNKIAGDILVSEYLDKLKSTLEKSLLADHDKLLIHATDDARIDSNKVVLIGLIINELITNSVKHGRLEDKALLLEVELVKVTEKFKLTVADNGKGFSENQTGKSHSIGMKLANGLAIQLGGKLLRLDTEVGTKFEINF